MARKYFHLQMFKKSIGWFPWVNSIDENVREQIGS